MHHGAGGRTRVGHVMRDITGVARRRAVIVGIALSVAAAHIIGLGRFLHGPLRVLYSGYFSDLVIPFTFYFLLTAAQVRTPALGRWQTRFGISVVLPSICETCQYFGIPLLGSTFDVLDYVMYGVGALTAVVVDTQLLARVFDWWRPANAES